jgi:pantoate--beta-alanine ligase
LQLIHTPQDWIQNRLKTIQMDKKVGFVPTMGALHEGHLDLVHQAKKECDICVVSIFVNPTQFNNPEDFEKYPSTLETDLQKLEKTGVDYVYLPLVSTIYPQKPILSLNFGELEHVLEGKFRPGHFNGVGIVVAKLFHHIQPEKAYFGQKDLQQVAVIRKLVIDLSFPIELVIVPTRREKDGLAMSSRNLRLNAQQRTQALILFQSLAKAKDKLLKGETWTTVQNQIQQDFDANPGAELEYFELIDPYLFTRFDAFESSQKSSICVAAYLGVVRLIDNMPIIS